MVTYILDCTFDHQDIHKLLMASDRPNHGLQTAYEFGEDIGGLERSRYFGYSKDLYHFDHFLGKPLLTISCSKEQPEC